MASSDKRSGVPSTAGMLPILSARLPDGGILETLLRRDPLLTTFLHFHEGKLTEREQFEASDGTVLVPYSPRNNLLTHEVVLLPTKVEQYETEEHLAVAIRDFIHRYVDVSPGFEAVATSYVLLTWVYDDFKELPYLRVRGDYGSGKSRFLQTVGSLCYKPIFASGASTVSPLFRILDAVQGTLVIDEGDFRMSDEKAEIVKILNNGNACGFPVLRSEVSASKEVNPRAFSVFGPKIIATRRFFEDPALESRCLTENMGQRRLRKDIPVNLPDEFAEESEELRNRLLGYRLRKIGTPWCLEAPEEGLSPRLQQLTAPLLAVTEDMDDREEILSRMGMLSGRLIRDHAEETPIQVLQVIAERLTSPKPITLSEIADAFRARFGEPYPGRVTARWVSTVLRKRLFVTPLKTRGISHIAPESYETLRYLSEKYGLVEKVLEGDEGGKGDKGGS